MQVLNISVNNRPSKSVTSKPYGISVREDVAVSLDLNYIGQTNYPLRESAQVSMSMVDGLWLNTKVGYKLDHESAVISMSMGDILITAQHTNYSTNIRENNVVSLSMNDIVTTTQYIAIKLTPDVESATLSLSMGDIITK